MPDAQAEEFTKSVVESSGGAIPALSNTGLPESYIQAAKDAFTEGTKWSAVAAGVFLLLGFVATFRLSSRQHGEPVKK
jgi:hypothetical protein